MPTWLRHQAAVSRSPSSSAVRGANPSAVAARETSTRIDHERLVTALVATEDALENAHRGTASKARLALRAIRREVEAQVWP